MKRAGNLAEKIGDVENLRAAFVKARRGCAEKSCARAFGERLDENLLRIREEWLAGTLTPDPYSEFTIYDPKKRVIHAPSFRDRVVQHAVMNVCDEFFEKAQIFDSYASRKGKGVDACLKRAAAFAGRYKWFVKFDIHKYFDSVEHGVLKAALARRFKDKTVLRYFFALIDGYETSRERGIPIGSLASQYFANLYLADADRFCKETLRVPAYVRYMDDFVLFLDDAAGAGAARERVSEFLKKTLLLEHNPVTTNTTAHGLTFLNYRVRDCGIFLSRKAKRRFVKKMAEASREEDAERTLSLIAFVRRARSFAFRRRVFFGSDSQGSQRVNRGGSWNNDAQNCRSANRNCNAPDNRNNNLGFRVSAAQRLMDFNS